MFDRLDQVASIAWYSYIGRIVDQHGHRIMLGTAKENGERANIIR